MISRIHLYSILLVIFVVNIVEIYAQGDDPVVETVYGRVSGKSVTLADGSVIDSYLAIPFAKPPVGDLRFELPEEPEPWDDILDGSNLGNACMQRYFSGVYLTHVGFSNFSEDCLQLNVYSPQREDPTELLPVMFWIHGGDYTAGANFIYPGYFLAQKGVVVVTVNYRLDIFGFAYSGDGVISGNMGLMDQILGLEFVRENIEAFGGDADRVTIFGESAGAGSVGQLLMSPLAAGLFSGAILQSGTELSVWSLFRPEMEPEKYIFDVANRLDCEYETSEEMVACLKEVGSRRLEQAQFNCTEGYECGSGFRPVVDGTILPDIPENLRESGSYNQVPELVGLTEDESNIFIAAFERQYLDRNGLNRTQFNEYLWDHVSWASVTWPDPSRAEDVYEAFNFFYADFPYYDDPERNRIMLGKLQTDENFGHSGDKQAKQHSRDGNPVYYYVFDFLMQSNDPEWFGVYHGMELSTLFGFPLIEDNEEAYIHSQLNPLSPGNYTVAEKEYSDFMMTLWTNFAKFGNPTPEPVNGPNGTLLSWLPFTEENLNYMNLQETPALKKDYRQKEYAFWNEYLRYLVHGEDFKSSFTLNTYSSLFSAESTECEVADIEPEDY